MEELVSAGLSPLIGREADLDTLTEMLSAERLITLTGPGGVGKTRVAFALLAAAPVETFSVELAPVADPELVGPSILAGAGARPEPGVDPAEKLALTLRGRESILLLDNCEHVRSAVAELCGRALLAAPGMRILATSRVPLGVPGEVRFELGPLSLGAEGDALRLFLDRARRVNRRFSADPAAVEQISRLCAELDGLPLAIELAAARTRLVGVAQMATDLDRRLDFVAGGPCDVSRHRSLRASMEWSCETLSPPERALFERVSVFSGGWRFEAAEAVCSGPPVSRESVLDLLGSLVDRSLVFVDRASSDARFGMLSTVHTYAAERLGSGDEAGRVRAAHADWCAALVESAERQLMGGDQSAALATLDRELDNVRAAVEWCRAHDPHQGLRISAATAPYWHARGHFGEGRRTLEALVPAGRTASPAVRARALWALALMLVASGDLSAARQTVKDAVGRARDLDEPGLLARALNLTAELDLMSDPVAARAPLQEAVALARRAGDEWCLADALGKLGAAALYRSDAVEAKAPLQECLEIARRTGDELASHRALGGLARVAAIDGDVSGSIELLRSGLALSQRLGDRSWIALDLAMLGELQRVAGRSADGQPVAERGLALAEEIDAGYPRYVATGILGRIALSRGDLDAATERFARAVELAENGGWRPFAAWWHLGLADVELERGRPDAVARHARAALAVAQAIGNRRDQARALAALGLAALERAEHEVAARDLSAALSVQREINDEPGARRTLSGLYRAFARDGQAERAERLHTALARGPGGLSEAIGIALRGRGQRSRTEEAGWGGLTRAEAEVAELAAAGASNPEIGARLFMSRSTVKTHLSRVYAKLGVANRTELASAISVVRQPR